MSEKPTGRYLPEELDLDAVREELEAEVDNVLERIAIENRRESFDGFNAAVFATILAVVAILLAVLPRPTESATEKRELTPMPSFSFEALFSGAYTMQLSEHYADTVPFREQLMEAGARVRELSGFRYAGVRLHDVARPTVNTDTPAQTNAEPSQSPAETQADGTVTETAPPAPAPEDEKDLQVIVNNGIATVGTRGLMLFGGSTAQAERYANTVSSYQQRLGSGVKVYSVVIPTGAEFYLPRAFSDRSSSQKENIEHLYATLSPQVVRVDAYSALEAHKNEEIFFRTDHHWAQLGAYYAYEAFAKTAGITCPPLSSFTEKRKEGYVGTLYGYTGDVVLKDNPEDFVYFLPSNSYETTYYNYGNSRVGQKGPLFVESASGSSMYSLFMGGDAKITKITTDVKNGRRAAVIKDSFGNAFAPFLVTGFEEVYVIDFRYFEYNAIDFLKEKGITDLLFVNNIFAVNTKSHIDRIERIRDQAEFVATKATKPTPPAVTETVPDAITPPETIPADATSAPPPETVPPADPVETATMPTGG